MSILYFFRPTEEKIQVAAFLTIVLTVVPLTVAVVISLSLGHFGVTINNDTMVCIAATATAACIYMLFPFFKFFDKRSNNENKSVLYQALIPTREKLLTIAWIGFGTAVGFLLPTPPNVVIFVLGTYFVGALGFYILACIISAMYSGS